MAQQIFEEINKLSLKFMCKSKIIENNSEKEQFGGLSDFKIIVNLQPSGQCSVCIMLG